MQATKTTTTRKAELILGIIGAAFCLVATIWLWQAISAIQTMWPLPALYLLEMTVLGFIALFSALRDFPIGGMVIWGIVGLFLGFVILGVWSVGPIYLPVALIFAITGFLYDRRNKQNIAVHLGICLITGVAQSALMLLVIQLRL